MLVELRIRNFALIEQCAIEFGPGLNVLSGETGAGKTIIMTALGLLLGARAAPDMVRHGCREATVEGLFDLTGETQWEADAGVELPPDGELLIKRTIGDGGRSKALVNEGLSTVQGLARIGTGLVQVYGQHEQQTLLRTPSHLPILDRFGELEPLLAAYRAQFDRASRLQDELAAMVERMGERERLLDLARFQVQELTAAGLQPGEEEHLTAQRHVLGNAARLSAAAEEAHELLYSGDNAAFDLTARAQARLEEAASIDGSLEETVGLVASARANLQEAAHRLRGYRDAIEADQDRLEQVEERLQLLARLKRKYGGSVESALERLAQARREVAEWEGAEDNIASLRAELAAALHQAADCAHRLSEGRRRAAAALKLRMEAELRTLGMANATFEARLEPLSDAGETLTFAGGVLGAAGAETVEFQLSANLGQPVLTLVRIASGGELSRVMLALKRLEAQRRGVATLIFDEVDAGIGGSIGQTVGRKLKELARFHQVLCVTHLAQIAACADRHFMVSKEEQGGATTSRVNELLGTARVEEVARMLGGAHGSEKFRKAARELIELAG